MRIADSLVEKILNSTGRISPDQINNLKTQEKAQNRALQDLVIANNLLTEAELTKLYAEEIDIPFIEIAINNIQISTLKKLPEEIARQYNAIVFGEETNGDLQVALEDPDDVQAINYLHKELGANIKVYITTRTLLYEALDLYRDNINSELTKVIQNDKPVEAIVDKPDNDMAEDSPSAKTVSILIDYGVKAGASDIHIEPRDDYVTVRYRIDGMLKEANKLPLKMLGSVISRIKILSNLKIDEHRAPQDGRFKMEIGGTVYALRVSTMPVLNGEKAAIRILN